MKRILGKLAVKLSLWVVAGLAGPVMMSPSQAAVIMGDFEMTGDQMAAPSGSSLVGHGKFLLNTEEESLTLLLKFVGDVDLDGTKTTSSADDVTGLHVRRASAGSSGPIVFGILSPSHEANDNTLLLPAQNQVLAIWDADEGATSLLAEMEHLMTGDLYVNLETAQFPEGEIRGQIAVPVPEPSAALLVLGTATLLGFSRGRRRC